MIILQIKLMCMGDSVSYYRIYISHRISLEHYISERIDSACPSIKWPLFESWLYSPASMLLQLTSGMQDALHTDSNLEGD